MQSVFSQTYEKLEYIVIDGGSTDGSAEYIEEHRARLAYAVSARDDGIYDAQNKGLAKAQADYVLVLNSGDELADKNVIADIFSVQQTCDIVYGDIYFSYPNGKRKRRRVPPKITYSYMMRAGLWHPASFVKHRFLQEVGFYDTSYRIVADYEWFLRAVFLHSATLTYIDRVVTIFDLEGLSAEPGNRAIIKAERRRAQVGVFGLDKVVAYEGRFFVRIRRWIRPSMWLRSLRQVLKL